MKQKRIRNWEFGEFVFVSILGTLLHFMYEWSGKNKVVAAFSAVNESTWEHLKLLFFPVLLYTLLEYVFLKEDFPLLWKIKGKAVLLGMVFIVVFFYTCSGILGKHYMWLDIGSFYVSALLVSIASYRMYKKDKGKEGHGNSLWIGMWLLMLGIFVYCTYMPPELGIFQPMSKVGKSVSIIAQKAALGGNCQIS